MDDELDEYECVLDYIEAHPGQFSNILKRRRESRKNKVSLWDTSWGEILQDLLLLIPKSAVVC